MNILDTYVLLWSKRHCALHIETMDAVLQSGRAAYRDDRALDYVPIHVGTLEEVKDTADSIRSTMARRAQERFDRSERCLTASAAT